MDHLWSPWRFGYVTGSERQPGCVFCHASRPPSAGLSAAASAKVDPLVVFTGSLAYVVLNKYPYSSGHVMVVPHRHVASLAELSADEMVEVAMLTQRCEVGLSEVYRPNGLNVGINLGQAAGAGIHEHLHVHVVPRWNGDSNFMTVVGETRVLPEDLVTSAERLRPVFARLA